VLRGRLIQALNAGQASTWTTTLASVPAWQADDRRSDTEIDKAVLAADARVCVARASTLGDGYRSLFLNDSGSIVHGAKIPDHLGPIEQVVIQHVSGGTFKAGKFDEHLELADIENWRENVGGIYGINHDASGSSISGFYIEHGSQLFYTGSDAKCLIANVTRTSACQAPEVDEDIVFGIALGNLLKEGDAGLHAEAIRDAREELARIEMRAQVSSPVQVAQAVEG
jgi:hypothetical protein